MPHLLHLKLLLTDLLLLITITTLPNTPYFLLLLQIPFIVFYFYHFAGCVNMG